MRRDLLSMALAVACNGRRRRGIKVPCQPLRVTPGKIRLRDEKLSR